jgi:alanine-alpha-ketoisovalerate/valine-pyruvate aminotransferase
MIAFNDALTDFSMRLSLFGTKLTGKAGILPLMDGLGTTVTADEHEIVIVFSSDVATLRT